MSKLRELLKEALEKAGTTYGDASDVIGLINKAILELTPQPLEWTYDGETLWRSGHYVIQLTLRTREFAAQFKGELPTYCESWKQAAAHCQALEDAARDPLARVRKLIESERQRVVRERNSISHGESAWHYFDGKAEGCNFALSILEKAQQS